MQKKLRARVRLLHLTQGKGEKKYGERQQRDTDIRDTRPQESNKKQLCVKKKPAILRESAIMFLYEITSLSGHSPSHAVCLYKALCNTTIPFSTTPANSIKHYFATLFKINVYNSYDFWQWICTIS